MTLCEVEPRTTPKRRKSDFPARPNVHRRAAAAMGRISWAYLVVLIAIWIFLRVAGDRFWLGTLMLFGPVWVTLLPLFVLVPGALIFRRKSLPLLAASAGIAVFMLMGFCIPWRAAIHRDAGGKSIRLVTCNVHGKSVLNKLIAANDPDIVLLQEWPGSKERPLVGMGPWRTQEAGELLIASRYPIVKSHVYTDATMSDWGGSAACYDIALPAGTVHLFNLHLASPHRPFDAVMAGKPEATQRLQKYLQIRADQSRLLSQLAADAGPNVILCGDFNTPCEGRVYQGYWSDFADAFSVAGFGLGHTYFAHGASVRIDHVLSGNSWRCKECYVGPFVGSPHRPVIADLTPTEIR